MNNKWKAKQSLLHLHSRLLSHFSFSSRLIFLLPINQWPFFIPDDFILVLILGALHLVAHEVVAVGIPPSKEVLLGEIGEQVAHAHVIEVGALGDEVGVDLDDDEHGDDEKAEGGVDDEGGDEQPVAREERVLDLLVVGGVDGLDDRQQRGGSEYADRHFEDAPGGRGRNHRPHRVDEADVGGHDEGGGTDLLAPHLVVRSRLAVQELDESEEGEEEDGDAELDDGAEGGLEHGDAQDGVAVGVLLGAVFGIREEGVAILVFAPIVRWVSVVRVFLVVDYLLAAEEAVLQAFIGGFIEPVLLLARVMDFDLVFDEVVVAELCGLAAQGEGYLHIAEEGIVLVRLELGLEDIGSELLAVLFLHVEVMDDVNKLLVVHLPPYQLTLLALWLVLHLQLLLESEPASFRIQQAILGQLYVHAVEADRELPVRGKVHFDGVEGGDEIEVVLLEREEEDV